MRKLVTIRKVDKLLPIPKKDRIELAVIGGWSLIVKKGEFQVNDFGVFFEIDSFLPNTEPYTFLGKTIKHQGKEGYRIKTMKMAGCISQGLLLTLSMFEPVIKNDIKEGMDITELLNVIKYDIDLVNNKGDKPQVTGQSKGKFPSFIPKTDQERIQNLSHYFNAYKDTEFEETLKLDGSSCTMFRTFINLPLWKKALNFIGLTKYTETHFGVCSIKFEFTKPKPEDKQSNFWLVANKYNIEKDLPVNYAVQGEIVAPNIQKNYEKVQEPEFYIFSVYNIKAQQYLSPIDARSFVYNYLSKARYVPVIRSSVKIFNECPTYDDFQKTVDDYSMNTEQTISEGRVYKSVDGSVSFKVINNKYLLQKGK